MIKDNVENISIAFTVCIIVLCLFFGSVKCCAIVKNADVEIETLRKESKELIINKGGIIAFPNEVIIESAKGDIMVTDTIRIKIPAAGLKTTNSR